MELFRMIPYEFQKIISYKWYFLNPPKRAVKHLSTDVDPHLWLIQQAQQKVEECIINGPNIKVRHLLPYETDISISELLQKIKAFAKAGYFKEIERLLWNETSIHREDVGQMVLEMVLPWDSGYKQKDVSGRRLEFLQHLFEMMGPKLNVNACDTFNRTLLMFSLNDQNVEVIKFLLKNGANIDSKTNIGITPLMWAVKRKAYSCVDLLIKSGADLDSQDTSGRTALMWSLKALNDKNRIKTFFENNAAIDKVDNDNKTMLMYVAETPYSEFINIIVSKDVDVNATDKEGNTALMYAGRAKQVACFRELLKNGADKKMKNKKNESALTIIEKSDDKQMESFLDAGSVVNKKRAEVFLDTARIENKEPKRVITDQAAEEKQQNIEENDGLDPQEREELWKHDFFKALSGGETDILEKLTRTKPSNVKFNETELCGENILIKVMSKNDWNMAEFLLDNGYDVNARGSGSPLQWAIDEKNDKFFDLLIKYKADVNLTKSQSHMTPLWKALIAGHNKQVQVLLENGANPNIKDERGYTMLSHAVIRNNTYAMKLILEKMELDIDITDEEGKSALHHAVLNDESEKGVNETLKETCTTVLLTNHSDPNIEDAFGCTPLIYAAMNNNTAAIKQLIHHKADINFQDEVGKNPLHYAANNDDDDSVKLLLKQMPDININVMDNENMTPLHCAASSGSRECLRLLLKHKPEVDIRDKSGKTGLHHAALVGSMDCLKILLDNQADVNIKDVDGRTALHHSAVVGSTECLEILLDHNADDDIKDYDGCTAIDCATNSYSRLCLHEWNKKKKFFTQLKVVMESLVFGMKVLDMMLIHIPKEIN
ncbi:unnamed protein product [Owenia fusiformis]|uniref:Uncharacterized protein n=1 Tax=Owenia fusiformis TaxID=6347 RepID=A0A8S4Q7Y9_OWEFU|nr:unnamed protein product [Owenia fusiformis]